MIPCAKQHIRTHKHFLSIIPPQRATSVKHKLLNLNILIVNERLANWTHLSKLWKTTSASRLNTLCLFSKHLREKMFKCRASCGLSLRLYLERDGARTIHQSYLCRIKIGNVCWWWHQPECSCFIQTKRCLVNWTA